MDGLKKVQQLSFLIEGTGRSLGQAAVKFILAEPSIGAVLPNIYNEQQLVEFAAAPDTPDFTTDELERVAQLYQNNFGLTTAEATAN